MPPSTLERIRGLAGAAPWLLLYASVGIPGLVLSLARRRRGLTQEANRGASHD